MQQRKRDLLPGRAHVTAWARRNQHYDTALTDLATAARWDTDLAATIAVARSIYSHLPPDGTPLWLGYKDVVAADARLRRAGYCPRSSTPRSGFLICRSRPTGD